MRLTLRTLLAYLDDMLDPSETKRIGQKVAESETAQELIARIKQVTRRRRLTTPPSTGPNAFEPNVVAEYLDNTLPPEQVAEVEKTCLESDVHLAEIAAAHQILTLVLGQPALVPPSAKKRMYALVHGRNAQPVRKAAPVAATVPGSADPRADEDETLLLGLSHRGQAVWLRWLLPISAALLLVVLAIALWQAFASSTGPAVVRGPETNLSGSGVGETPKTPDTGKGNGESSKGPAQGGNTPGEGNTPGNGGTPIGGGTQGHDGHPAPPFATPKPMPPSKDRKDLARYVLPVGWSPNILASRPTEGPFQRVKSGARVFSTDFLVSLPGYRSELQSDSGVGLTLWGHLPEFSDTMTPIRLFDSAATLYVPDKGIDLDFALDRGAVLIVNRKEKDAAVVRLRLLDQVWDLSLAEPGTEIAVSMWSLYLTPYESGEAPSSVVNLFVRKGKAAARIGFEEYPNIDSDPVPKVIYWDNNIGRVQAPVPVQTVEDKDLLSVWGDLRLPANPEKVPVSDAAIAARRTLSELSMRLAEVKPLETALREALQPDSKADLTLRVFAVHALGSLDALSALVDILGDSKQRFECRDAAIHALRQFIARNGGQEAKLYDPKAKKGALIDKNFRTADARQLLELLHFYSKEQRASPDFWQGLAHLLVHDKQALRELAYWHLFRLLPEGRQFRYDAADPPDVLQAKAQQWKELVDLKSMPPKKP